MSEKEVEVKKKEKGVGGGEENENVRGQRNVFPRSRRDVDIDNGERRTTRQPLGDNKETPCNSTQQSGIRFDVRLDGGLRRRTEEEEEAERGLR